VTRFGGGECARETIERLFSASLRAVDPDRVVRATLSWDGTLLRVGEFSVRPSHGIHVVAVGKAAVAMAHGALAVLGDAVVSGDVITKDGHLHQALPGRLRVAEAAHPIPDVRGVEATMRMLESLEALDDEVLVLALISGGGSALLEAPRSGLTLDDLAQTTALLLRAGAPIDALNRVRAPLSRVKAGGLRRAAPRAVWITLILSDVLGNDPRVIASGPTVPSPFDPESAVAVLDRFGVRDQVPDRVIAALRRLEDEPAVEIVGESVLRVVADNRAAVMAAAEEASRLGLRSEVIWEGVEGEAADLGRAWVDAVTQVSTEFNVLLGGGEATVTVRGDGRGGRNTEFALAAALELEQRGVGDWTLASLATDGQDALTGVAGAIADGGTARRARQMGLDPAEALSRNDSLAVFGAVGGALETGPTGTNVNDLYVAVRVR
jgi:hydroxypyruvate reductase